MISLSTPFYTGALPHGLFDAISGLIAEQPGNPALALLSVIALAVFSDFKKLIRSLENLAEYQPVGFIVLFTIPVIGHRSAAAVRTRTVNKKEFSRILTFGYRQESYVALRVKSASRTLSLSAAATI